MAKRSVVKFFVILGAIVLIFVPSFARYQELCYKNRALENRIKAIREEIKKLEAERIRLQTDISYIEKKARDRMGVVRKGEIVMKKTPAKK